MSAAFGSRRIFRRTVSTSARKACDNRVICVQESERVGHGCNIREVCKQIHIDFSQQAEKRSNKFNRIRVS